MVERFSLRETGYFQYAPEKLLVARYRNGQSLELPKSGVSIVGSQWLQMRELLESYRPHLNKYGEESIAQLGLSLTQMKALTSRVWYFVRDQVEDGTINTIEELRTLLDSSPGPYYKRENMYSKILRKPLYNRLIEWDKISDPVTLVGKAT